VLRFLGPGEILGESAFMAETPYVDTHRNNTVVRGVLTVADNITTEARDQAALSGRSA